MKLLGWSRVNAIETPSVTLDFCLWLHNNFDQLVEEINDQGPVNDAAAAAAAAAAVSAAAFAATA